MEALYYISVFLLGAIIGSFLNVVIYRYNSGLSPLKGRSICFSCGHELYWYNLIPLFSFVIQGGRCSFCRSRISVQYPLIEFLTALFFVVIFYKLGLSFLTLYYWLFFSILIIIAAYDLRHKIIPDGLVYFLILLSLLKIVTDFWLFGEINWYDITTAAIVALVFGLMWLISNGKWMGFGDAKLVLALGLVLSFCSILAFVFFSFILGSVVIILVMLLFKLYEILFGYRIEIDREVPFAPFLILSAFLVFMINTNYCLVLLGQI